MALTINAVDERGLSNELHCQLQPMKAKVMVFGGKWYFTQLYNTNTMDCFSFNSGHVIQVYVEIPWLGDRALKLAGKSKLATENKLQVNRSIEEAFHIIYVSAVR